MASLKELREQRAAIVTQVRAIAKEFNDNGKVWKDAEAEANWKKINDDEAALAAQIRTAEAADEVEQRLKSLEDFENRSVNHGQVIPGNEDTRHTRKMDDNSIDERDQSIAMAAWCKRQLGKNVNAIELDTMRRCGMDPDSKELVIDSLPGRYINDCARDFRNRNQDRAEQRNLSAYITGSGGVLAPPSFLKSLEINMLAFGGIRQVAEMITTGSGERMSWPTVDDTANKATRLGEGGTVPSSTDPTFGAVYWDAYKYVSTCLVPYELIEDSFLDLPSTLGQLLGIRHGRKTADDFTTGTGNSQPKGIITASSSGFTATNATSIVYKDVVNLIHSVDPAYRERPTVGFMCHDTAIMQLRLILDSYGRPLWQDGMGVGTPDKLFGYTVTRNQSMQNCTTIASGYKSLLFGDLNAYKIRRVNGIRFYRLQERYRDQDLDGFVLLVREDGNLLTAGTSPTKYLTH